MKRPFRIALLCALCLTLMAGCRKTERTEAVTAETEADQIIEESSMFTASLEAAHNLGRSDARQLINEEWQDTALFVSRADSLHLAAAAFLDSIGDRRLHVAYDSALVSTVRTVRPELGRHIVLSPLPSETTSTDSLPAAGGAQ